MNTMKDYMEIAVNAVSAFGNAGKLDEIELDKLLGIAVRDNSLDEDEIRVLRNIFSRMKSHEFSFAMREKIHGIEREYSVSLL